MYNERERERERERESEWVKWERCAEKDIFINNLENRARYEEISILDILIDMNVLEGIDRLFGWLLVRALRFDGKGSQGWKMEERNLKPPTESWNHFKNHYQAEN